MLAPVDHGQVVHAAATWYIAACELAAAAACPIRHQSHHLSQKSCDHESCEYGANISACIEVL